MGAVKYLTVGEVAERLGVSKAAVYAMCDRDRPTIRHLRIGVARSTIRVPVDAFDEFVTGSTVEPDERPAERFTSTYIPKYLKY